MELLFDLMKSPVGTLTLVWEGDAVRALEFDDHQGRLERLLTSHYGAYRLQKGRAQQWLRAPLEAYFEGELRAIESVPVHTNGTAFQQQIWAALRHIPAGATMSYGELARRLGRPSASRAVGLANGSNPVAIIVPCHRVIGASGALTGYGGGIERKRWLLEHERRSQGLAIPETCCSK